MHQFPVRLNLVKDCCRGLNLDNVLWEMVFWMLARLNSCLVNYALRKRRATLFHDDTHWELFDLILQRVLHEHYLGAAPKSILFDYHDY